jgi:CheY-like chemotaxis protein
MIRVRLTRKLAERINGVDLADVRVGDVFDLSEQAARMLIAEGWAETVVEEPLRKTRASGATLTSRYAPQMATSVLVVDDERDDREFLQLWLEQWGYSVTQAGSAKEALGAMLVDPARIILCDILMPEYDGLWLVDRVRKKWPRTAVVMATAVSDPQTVLKAKKAGAVDYVTKPFQQDILRQALRRADDATHSPRSQ